ncbi:RHS repeat domain-containing protein [Arsenophonus sp. ENCA]|uniref:RHS repeat domain-containing protein n=1 Tax=Arsenophonus sp. ENCA TaxID=1987579 RepID=UPI0025BCA3EE|nr:RHS repeat domain-containing protein [Arsenophonus sp. ENCA]
MVLATNSVDAGTTFDLHDIAGRPTFAISATGVFRSWQYEDSQQLGRPINITEQLPSKTKYVTERFIWAGNSDSEKQKNLLGQCLRHYDTAGLQQVNSIALVGVPLSLTQQLLINNKETNWQAEDETIWQSYLSNDSYTTQNIVDASGALLLNIDAKGNRRRLEYDIAGMLKSSWLTIENATEQIIIKSLTYSAAGQKLREEHGNGIVTSYLYEPQTQRLIAAKIKRPAAHQMAAKILQDLRYQYDPVGNVINVRNDAEVTRFWHNQKVIPENTYTYDTLYQLVSTTGRVMANLQPQSFTLPSPIIPLPADNSVYTNYIRHYVYDVAGNLTQIRHSAPASNNSYTTNITVSNRSNRAVLSNLTSDPLQVDELFDAGGHQTELQPAQAVNWSFRGELLQITPVKRQQQASDHETYRYDACGQRITKTTTSQTANSIHLQQVIYLSGLQLHISQINETLTEDLHILTFADTEQAQVQVLHWQTGKPTGIENNQLRYSYHNLIGSSAIEIDGQGQVISQEEYYPYGGSSIWTTSSQVEADYKIFRYSGKERDATGLYYYGHRYYQPWIGRWLSSDPAGTVDGLNLYRMVKNNPIMYSDERGESSRNRFRNIFIVSTYLSRREGEPIRRSLARGMKITRAVMGGLAIVAIGLTIAGAVSASGGILVAVGIGSFIIGAIAGWNLNQLSGGIASFFRKRLQGRSTTENMAAGATLSAVTAHLNGARLISTGIASAVGSISGAAGGLIGNSERGMGGAHAAGVAIGIVNIIGGKGTSLAMEVSAATFGAASGFITGVKHSARVGQYAAYGSYTGGIIGRHADNISSYAFNYAGGAIVRHGSEALFAAYVGNNSISRFVGRSLGDKIFSFFSRKISVGGPNEWMGSAIGATILGIGSALQLTITNPYFQYVTGKFIQFLNWLGGNTMNLMKRFILPDAAKALAIDAVRSTARRMVRGGVSF